MNKKVELARKRLEASFTKCCGRRSRHHREQAAVHVGDGFAVLRQIGFVALQGDHYVEKEPNLTAKWATAGPKDTGRLSRAGMRAANGPGG